MIDQAIKESDISPREVSYVEAHGTGTPVGDPIEIASLGKAYGEQRTHEDPLYIGSVKTNIGHLETASGVAGFIKTVLALQNEAIPPNLHFHQPNTSIPWDQLPVKIPTTLTPWKRSDQRRIAAVSSFGISGTNAHVILEEAPAETVSPEPADRSAELLTLAAKGKSTLTTVAERYVEFLADDSAASLNEVCHSVHVGRSHFKHRLAVVGATKQEVREKLVASPLASRLLESCRRTRW